mmetsp:Transcript_31961/g.69024  ORF Transcript_31961/g.69024 Transcript_31961/m.69024 type:complete len:133 (-) Transcript_31961:287-685(-)
MREMIKDAIWDNVLPKFRHRSPIDLLSVHTASSQRRKRASDSVRVDLRLVTYESHAKQIADSITAATNTGRLVASLRQGGLVNVDAASVAMDMERVAPPPVEWDRAARLATTPTCVLVSAVTLSLLVFGPLF